MNLLLAAALFYAVFMLGLTTETPRISAVDQARPPRARCSCTRPARRRRLGRGAGLRQEIASSPSTARPVESFNDIQTLVVTSRAAAISSSSWSAPAPREKPPPRSRTASRRTRTRLRLLQVGLSPMMSRRSSREARNDEQRDLPETAEDPWRAGGHRAGLDAGRRERAARVDGLRPGRSRAVGAGSPLKALSSGRPGQRPVSTSRCVPACRPQHGRSFRNPGARACWCRLSTCSRAARSWWLPMSPRTPRRAGSSRRRGRPNGPTPTGRRRPRAFRSCGPTRTERSPSSSCMSGDAWGASNSPEREGPEVRADRHQPRRLGGGRELGRAWPSGEIHVDDRDPAGEQTGRAARSAAARYTDRLRERRADADALRDVRGSAARRINEHAAGDGRADGPPPPTAAQRETGATPATETVKLNLTPPRAAALATLVVSIAGSELLSARTRRTPGVEPAGRDRPRRARDARRHDDDLHDLPALFQGSIGRAPQKDRGYRPHRHAARKPRLCG